MSGAFFILILLKRNAFCVFLEVFRTGQDQNTLYEAPNFRNDCQSKARKNGNQQLCNRFSDITKIKVMYAKSTQQNAKNTCGNLRFRSSCPRNTSSRSRSSNKPPHSDQLICRNSGNKDCPVQQQRRSSRKKPHLDSIDFHNFYNTYIPLLRFYII